MSTYYGLDFSERNISSVEAEQAFPILDAYVRKAHTSQISKFSSILQFAVNELVNVNTVGGGWNTLAVASRITKCSPENRGDE